MSFRETVLLMDFKTRTSYIVFSFLHESKWKKWLKLILRNSKSSLNEWKRAEAYEKAYWTILSLPRGRYFPPTREKVMRSRIVSTHSIHSSILSFMCDWRNTHTVTHIRTHRLTVSYFFLFSVLKNKNRQGPYTETTWSPIWCVKTRRSEGRDKGGCRDQQEMQYQTQDLNGAIPDDRNFSWISKVWLY